MHVKEQDTHILKNILMIFDNLQRRKDTSVEARTQLKEEATTQLIASFNQLKSLHLDLSHHAMDDLAATALAEALTTCKAYQPTHLDLSHNEIHPGGIKALAQALKHKNRLESLNLSHNEIHPGGIKALAQALKHKNRLESLNLSCNPIGTTGATEIPKIFNDNTSKLQTLLLHNSMINPIGIITLASHLKRSNLKSLDLSHNAITHTAAQALSKALPVCKLQTLTLSSEDMSSTVKKGLLAAAEHSPVTIVFNDPKPYTQIAPALAINIGLSLLFGLATTAFTAHMLGLTVATATLLSTPFAMSLAVGVVVTTLAFCAASSCMSVCLPHIQTASQTSSSALGLAVSNTRVKHDPAEATAAHSTVAAHPAA